MRIDNGVIARGEDGFAGENRRGESLIGERTVDDRIGDPYTGDVDGAGGLRIKCIKCLQIFCKNTGQ